MRLGRRKRRNLRRRDWDGEAAPHRKFGSVRRGRGGRGNRLDAPPDSREVRQCGSATISAICAGRVWTQIRPGTRRPVRGLHELGIAFRGQDGAGRPFFVMRG